MRRFLGIAGLIAGLICLIASLICWFTHDREWGIYLLLFAVLALNGADKQQ